MNPNHRGLQCELEGTRNHFVSVCEEKTVYFQNKLIEAYEKKENLTNRMAKDILDDQISFYKKKIEELREN